jgi:hypothetical protein
MALSPAMQWALNNGMTEADVYKNINDFLATNPDAATTQAQMAQYGISGADVAAATGGTSGGMLGGNILAGASWNSLNTTLGDQLTAATGQASSNYSVGGATTADTLKQLNTFLAGGGQFDPNATVYLQTGGVDFLQGVDKGTIKDNINQMVKTLGSQGVNVVLTGSPYAASLNDVQTNNFNPAVDPIFTQIANENKNVALVGNQGEILQNKALLVDALHTNAEGTAIYNQSVIDALSQFKNEVPSSTPQAIAQVQKSNTVPVAAPVIIQAAENKASIQDQLKNQILSQGTTSQWQGEGKGSADANAADMAKILVDTGITDLSQFGKVTKTVDVAVQPVYDYKEIDYGGETGVQLSPFIVGYTDQNGNSIDPSLVKTDVAQVGSGDNTSYETVYVAPIGKEEVFGNKVTGQEVANTYGERQTGDAFGGTYTGKGNTAYNVQFDESGKPVFYTTGASSSDTKDIARIIQAGLLLSGAGGALGGALGLTGAAAQGVGTGLITAGSTAIGGGSGSDILKAGLLGGGLAYGGKLLGNYLDTGTTADLGITERQFAIQDAKQLADQGLTAAQIKDTLTAGGYNEAIIDRALTAVTGTTPTTAPTNIPATTTTATNTVNVTGTSTPALNTGGLLGGLVTPPVAVSTPVTDGGSVNVTGTTTPQLVDQSVLNLVNSQLASNVTTPANLANVTVTGDRGLMSGNNTNTAILNTLAGLSTTPAATTNLPTTTITATKPATAQEIVTAITSTLPNVTAAQAATVAEQVITSGKPVTTQEVISAITAALPAVTTPAITPTSTVPTTTITAPRPVVTTQDLVGAITATLPPVTTPTVTTPNIPTTTITAPRPTPVGDTLAVLPATLLPPSVTNPPVDLNKKNELGLTDAQMLALLQGGLGLLGGLGGASLIGGGGGTTNIGGIPTQGMPSYNDDYFTKVQQNYNRILPAVPRDVASPLRDWYLSQYGA